MFKGYFKIYPIVGLFNLSGIGMSGVTRGLKLTIDRSLNSVQLVTSQICLEPSLLYDFAVYLNLVHLLVLFKHIVQS